MNRAGSGRSGGFTIVESMIYLAVSAGIFLSAIAVIGGKQNKTEFTTGLRDFTASIDQVAGDVSNGYYNNVSSGGATGISCSVRGTGTRTFAISDSQSTDKQGSNQGCIFIGKTLGFNLTDLSSTNKYTVISLAGMQYSQNDPNNGNSQNYGDSLIRPLVSAGINDTTPDNTQQEPLNNGVTVGCVLYAATTSDMPDTTTPCAASSTLYRTNSITFMTTFGSSYVDSNGVTQSGGSISVNLLVPNATSAGPTVVSSQTTTSLASQLIAAGNTGPSAPKPPLISPAGGVYICIDGGPNEYGMIELGGQQNQFTDSTSIHDGSCSS